MNYRIDHIVYRVLILAFLGGTPVIAQQALEEWEYQGSMNMMGMSIPIPATKRCEVPEKSMTPPMESNCQFSDVQTQGDTTSFKVECGPPESMSGSGTTTRTSDRLESSYTLKSVEGEMSFTLTGRKLGACTP